MAHIQNTRNRQRRDLLRRGIGCALAGAGAGAFGGKLGLVGSALAAGGDYAGLSDHRTLVCVFLYGGSDSFNLFVPTDANLMADYRSSRGVLALPESQLIASERDPSVAFNARLPEMRALYDQGRAAVVANVGNLITPVTRAGFEAGTDRVPDDLFAHNHQQQQWMKGYPSRPAARVGAGWGGRMADLLLEANGSAALPCAISLAGSNAFLPGLTTRSLSVDPLYGPKRLYWMDGRTGGTRNSLRAASMDRILALQSGHLLKAFAADGYRGALDSSEALVSALAANPRSDDPGFAGAGRFGLQLRMAAQLIGARRSLGQKRQILFVGLGGWDTHDAQGARLAQLSGILDQGLAAFHRTVQAMPEVDDDSVTAFTASDFGRTLTINGDGSDHGWGGHYLVTGGAVRGGQVAGRWPSYRIDGEDDAGDKGRMIPSMSINQYGAALARWMGLSNRDVTALFPDLQRGFDTGWQDGYGLFDVA